MKIGLLWQLLLAVACLALIGALFYTPESAPITAEVEPTETPEPTLEPGGDVCVQPVPVAGGFFIEGIVGAPLYPNPILADSNPVDREIVDLLFDGLITVDERGRPQPALAESWTVSDDQLRVRFDLREDVVWHDGQPFTAQDVAFTYNLLDGLLWDSVAITIVDDSTIEFLLPEPYAPFLEATMRGILPAHLLSDVSSADDLTRHLYNNRPIGTGPFVASNDWLNNGYLRFIPNPNYWQNDVQVDGIEMRFYANDAERNTAFANGEIHAMLRVPANAIPDVTRIDGVRLFTSAETQFTQLLFNLSESGHQAVRDLTVRQALSFALDRDILLAQSMNGQGLPFSGPYLPNSWAYLDDLTPTATNLLSATRLLNNSPWFVPDDGTIRVDFEENPLRLRLLATDKPSHGVLANTISAQWAAVGVAVEQTTVAMPVYREMLQTREFDVAIMEIDPLNDPDLYDFWSQEAIVDGQNYGGWNDRRASEALEGARQTWLIEDRLPFYNTFLDRFATALPAISLFQHVNTYVLSDEVDSADLGRIIHPRDRFTTLPNWHVLTREIAVSCVEN